jgi:glycosyltransferase involved in cell wall biosynthesis
VLYVPMLFGAERWNGIMEHVRILVGALGPSIEPLVAVRHADGEQTPVLAQLTGMQPRRLGDRRSALELARLCRRERIDIVHIHTPVAGGVPRLALGARLARAAVIVTYHQVQLEPAGRGRRALNRLTQRALVRTGIAVSAAVRESLTTYAGLDPTRIRVLYNGVAPYVATKDAAPLDLDQSAIWAGYFGRLADEKLIDVLLRALGTARIDEPRLRLLVVGDGYARERLEALTRELALGDVVIFAGHRPDARALMRRVALVVHPARFEGLPYALIEAMEAGRAIVAARAGGVPEAVLDGVNGIIVDPGDAHALAAAVLRLVQDDTLREAFERGARARYASMFSAAHMAEQTLAVYEAAR